MLKIWQLNLVKMPENSSSLSCRAHAWTLWLHAYVRTLLFSGRKKDGNYGGPRLIS